MRYLHYTESKPYLIFMFGRFKAAKKLFVKVINVTEIVTKYLRLCYNSAKISVCFGTKVRFGRISMFGLKLVRQNEVQFEVRGKSKFRTLQPYPMTTKLKIPTTNQPKM